MGRGGLGVAAGQSSWHPSGPAVGGSQGCTVTVVLSPLT